MINFVIEINTLIVIRKINVVRSGRTSVQQTFMTMFTFVIVQIQDIIWVNEEDYDLVYQLYQSDYH